MNPPEPATQPPEADHIKCLVPDPQNARQHSPKNIGVIADSLHAVGAARSIVIDENNVVLAGNGVLEAAGQSGITKLKIVDVDGETLVAVRRTGLTDKMKARLALDDNRAGELSEWNDAELQKLLLNFNPDELKSMAFSEQDMKNLGMMPEAGGADAEAQVDNAAELNKIWGVKPGDLWSIGEHRLLCGDSVKPEDAARLMDGKRARMIHTDPPYNVDYGVSKNPRHKIRTIANDKQSPEKWEAFCKALFENFKNHNEGDVYMWGASGPEGMRLWLVEHGCHWSATIVWKKQQLVLSPANYQRMYEPCFYGWFDKSSFSADRKQTEVWEFDRPTDSKLHPTMKPIDLCAQAIINSSLPGDVVLDFFLGSGSTMVAAEGQHRKCYGIEISENYCAVILQRMKDAFPLLEIKKLA